MAMHSTDWLLLVTHQPIFCLNSGRERGGRDQVKSMPELLKETPSTSVKSVAKLGSLHWRGEKGSVEFHLKTHLYAL